MVIFILFLQDIREINFLFYNQCLQRDSQRKQTNILFAVIIVNEMETEKLQHNL